MNIQSISSEVGNFDPGIGLTNLTVIQNVGNNPISTIHTLENMNSFSSFVVNNSRIYNNSYIAGFIKNNLSSNKIGEGGMGAIYNLRNADGKQSKLIVKVIDPCKPEFFNRGLLNQKLCYSFNRDNESVIVIPGGDEKTTTYRCLNIYSEILIGTLTTKLVNDNLTPFFPYFVGGVFDTGDIPKKFYYVMETLQTDAFEEFFTGPDYDMTKMFYRTLFCIFQGLNVAQKKLKLLHNDLHFGNILKRPMTERQVVCIKNGNRYVYITGKNVPVINDFGLSSATIETSDRKKYNIIPKIFINDPDQNFGIFLPYLDMLLFFGYISFYKRSKDDNIVVSQVQYNGVNTVSYVSNNIASKYPFFGRLWANKLYFEYMSLVLGVPLDAQGLQTIHDYVTFVYSKDGSFFWRPSQNLQKLNNSPNPNIKNIKYRYIGNIVKYILEIYISNQPESDLDVNKNPIGYFNKALSSRENLMMTTKDIKIHQLIMNLGLDVKIYDQNSKSELTTQRNEPFYKMIQTTFDNTNNNNLDMSWLTVETYVSPQIIVNPDQSLSKISPSIAGVPLFDISGIPGYTRTPSTALYTCDNSKQIIHLAYIDIALAKLNGFSVRNDCCDLDLFSYLENYNEGFVVNTTFFDIRDDFATGKTKSYRPIGEFKNKYYNKVKGSNDFPLMYIQAAEKNRPGSSKFLYPVVVFDNDDDVDIIPWDDGVPLRYSKYFRAGPLLFYYDNARYFDVMTEDTLRTLFDVQLPEKAYLFQSQESGSENRDVEFRKPISSDYKVVQGRCENQDPNVDFDTLVPNVFTISPGELAHAGNPNPRMALVIRDVSKITSGPRTKHVFVFVEGRTQESSGVDFKDLTDICKRIPGAILAINLDGGGSAGFMWKSSEFRDQIFTPNTNSTYSYPIGGVFSIVR